MITIGVGCRRVNDLEAYLDFMSRLRRYIAETTLMLNSMPTKASPNQDKCRAAVNAWRGSQRHRHTNDRGYRRCRCVDRTRSAGARQIDLNPGVGRTAPK